MAEAAKTETPQRSIVVSFFIAEIFGDNINVKLYGTKPEQMICFEKNVKKGQSMERCKIVRKNVKTMEIISSEVRPYKNFDAFRHFLWDIDKTGCKSIEIQARELPFIVDMPIMNQLRAMIFWVKKGDGLEEFIQQIDPMIHICFFEWPKEVLEQFANTTAFNKLKDVCIYPHTSTDRLALLKSNVVSLEVNGQIDDCHFAVYSKINQWIYNNDSIMERFEVKPFENVDGFKDEYIRTLPVIGMYTREGLTQCTLQRVDGKVATMTIQNNTFILSSGRKWDIKPRMIFGPRDENLPELSAADPVNVPN